MKDRLLMFMQSKSISAGKLAEMIGVQPSAISHIMSGRNKPGFDFLAGLFKKFPDLNPRWLIVGEGGMNVEHGHHYDQNELLTAGGTHMDLLSDSPIPTIDVASAKITPSNGINKELITHSKSIERIVIFYVDGTFSGYDQR